MRVQTGTRSGEHGDGAQPAARRRILARTAVASGVAASAVGGVLAVQGGGGSMAADAASAAVRTVPAPVVGQDLTEAAGVVTPSFLGDIASVASVASLVISVANVLQLVKGGGDAAAVADK